jgi:hypothetical protein
VPRPGVSASSNTRASVGTPTSWGGLRHDFVDLTAYWTHEKACKLVVLARNELIRLCGCHGRASIMCVGLGKSLKSVTFQKVQSLLKYQS